MSHISRNGTSRFYLTSSYLVSIYQAIAMEGKIRSICSIIEAKWIMVNNGPCQMKGVVYGAKVIKNTEQTTEFYTELTTRVFNPISLRAPPGQHFCDCSEPWKLGSSIFPRTKLSKCCKKNLLNILERKLLYNSYG